MTDEEVSNFLIVLGQYRDGNKYSYPCIITVFVYEKCESVAYVAYTVYKE